jgi:hypothetical protein
MHLKVLFRSTSARQIQISIKNMAVQSSSKRANKKPIEALPSGKEPSCSTYNAKHVPCLTGYQDLLFSASLHRK